MKSPIIYYGGKGILASTLLSLVPPHEEYIEPFFGGGNLFFMKKPVVTETINDIDSIVMDFYRVLRDPELFERFQRMAELTQYSRELFYECRDTWQQADDIVDRAWRWYVCVMQSFGADQKAFGVVKSGKKPGHRAIKFLAAVDRLPEVHTRLSRIQIENNDFAKVIKDRCCGRSTFIYCDPPYVASTRVGADDYRYEMDDSDHERFLQAVTASPGKVMISGYHSELYAEYLKDWKLVEIETVAHTGPMPGVKKPSRTECVWMNYFNVEMIPWLKS